MPLIHDKLELAEAVKLITDGMLKDGILIDVPKRRRREQAQNKRPFLIKMAPEHKLRFGKQFNRFVEIFGKDLGAEVLLKILERYTDEDLKKILADTEQDHGVPKAEVPPSPFSDEAAKQDSDFALGRDSYEVE